MFNSVGDKQTKDQYQVDLLLQGAHAGWGAKDKAGDAQKKITQKD